MSAHQFESISNNLADNGFAVTDQFLNLNEVRNITGLDVFKDGSLRKAGIGKGNKQLNEAIRGDSIFWIDRSAAHPPLKGYLDKLNELRLYLNQSLFLSLKDCEVHLASYPPGSFYKRHLDQFKSDDHRKLSVITYLNEDWNDEHGGQLRVYLPDGHQDFLPLAGRLICFRSDMIEHEVLPATRERLSVTGWMLDQLSDLRHL